MESKKKGAMSILSSFKLVKKRRDPHSRLNARKRRWKEYFLNTGEDYMEFTNKKISKLTKDKWVGANEVLELLAESKVSIPDHDIQPPPAPACPIVTPHIDNQARGADQKREDAGYGDEKQDDSEDAQYARDIKNKIATKVASLSVRKLSNEIGHKMMLLNSALLQSLPFSPSSEYITTKYVEIGKNLYSSFFKSLFHKSSGVLHVSGVSKNVFGITSVDNFKKIFDPNAMQVTYGEGEEASNSKIIVTNENPAYIQVSKSSYKVRIVYRAVVSVTRQGEEVASMDVFG